MASAFTFVLKTAIAVHRWLGVPIAAVLMMWFLSGIVMMYRSYPTVTAEDRIARLPRLTPSRVTLSADEAFAKAGLDEPRGYALLTSFDGRPAYASGGVLVYADDGTLQTEVSAGLLDRSAAAWARQPIAAATRTSVGDPDQWTLSAGVRDLRPLFKYAWPDGQHVYVDGRTGDVVQHTTRASRFWAYLGAIPHWMYFTPIRTHVGWFRIVVWTSLAGVATSLLGLLVAAWMYSPRKRYRHAGVPTAIPYKGWKRLHMVTGLAVGVVAVTWTFSGWLTMGPFPIMERVSSWMAPAEDGGSTDFDRALPDLLRGPRLEADRYTRTPQQALALAPDFDTRELEYTSFDGEALYLLSNAAGGTRIVPMRGAPRESFDADFLLARLREAGGSSLADLRLLPQYDDYYLDRRGRRPLPVIQARVADAAGTRYYIDPATASVVSVYSSRQWVDRWLSRGLHSFEFAWLYNHRPLWDVVVIGLLLMGAGLCLTSLVLAWRAVGRLLTSVWRARMMPVSDDLALDPALPFSAATGAGVSIAVAAGPAAQAPRNR